MLTKDLSNYQSMLLMKIKKKNPYPSLMPYFTAVYFLYIQILETAPTNISTFTFLNLILLGSSMPVDTFGHLTLPQNHSIDSTP